MQDEAVFPALEAMSPNSTPTWFSSANRVLGHWRVGGKDFISVGPAWMDDKWHGVSWKPERTLRCSRRFSNLLNFEELPWPRPFWWTCC